MKDIQTRQIEDVLGSLSLSSEAAQIYIYLCQNGHSSALNIAGKTGVSRTQVYRHLDELTKLNLVSEEKPYWGTFFYALPISNLQTEIKLRSEKLDETLTKLKAAESSFEDLFQQADPTQTVTYRGVAGLKQALWNITKAEKEYRVFEVDHLSNLLDIKFSHSLRQQQINRRIKSFDLSNRRNHSRKELEPYEGRLNSIKFIPEDILKIKFEIIIYDNTVTLIDYFANEPTALEVKNPALSLMMRQMHSAFWAMAKEILWKD